MLVTPVGTLFPPNLNLMEPLDPSKDLYFERDFGEWFNSVKDELGSGV